MLQITQPETESDAFTLAAEMSVVRLHDAWARFCRELVIVSAARRPITLAGVRLGKVPGINSIRDVIPCLLGTYKRRKMEPRWASALECIDAAQRLRIQNLATVSGAIGSVSSPVDDLRAIRNYFNHRGQITVSDLLKRNWYKPGMHVNLVGLLTQPVTGGITLWESWINGLRIIARAAIQ